MAEFDFGAGMDGYLAKKKEELDAGFGGVMDSYVRSKNQQFLGQLNQAVDINPDKFNADRKTAQLLARPVAAVEALPEDSARAAKVKTLQDDTVNAPVLRQQYTDADFAKLAHDDSKPLSAIEALIGAGNFVGKAARSIASGVPRLSAGLWGAGAAVPGLLGASDAEKWMLGQQKIAQGLADSVQGLDPKAGLLEKSVMSGFQSAGQNLFLLPLGLSRATAEVGTNAVLTAMGLATGGESYGKARNKGVDPYKSTAFAIEDATAEVVFEKYFGIGGLLKNVKAGAGAGKLLVYEISKELPGEMATTLVQNFNEWGNVNPDKSVGQFLSEQPEALLQTAISTIVGGGTQIGAIKTAEKVLGSFADHEAQMQQAEAQRVMLEQLSKLTQESKLKARDAETFQRYLDAATDGTPVQDLYIGANVLMQSGVGEQVAQVLPSVAEQLPAALESDGFVRIPISQYASTIAGSQFEQALIDHVKIDPNGYTFAESKEYADSFNQEMQTQLERAIVAQEGDASFKAERDQVREQFLGQLNQAKRFTEDVNGAYASMLSNFYAVTAAKLGMTPMELVNRYQLNIGGRSQAAAQFDQDGKRITDSENFRNWYGEWQNPNNGTLDGRGSADVNSLQREGEVGGNPVGGLVVGNITFPGASGPIGRDGKPVVFFHGTRDNIHAFDTQHPNRKDKGWLGRGVYVASDSQDAETYSRMKRGNENPTILPLFVAVKNPYVADITVKERLKDATQEEIDAFTQGLKDQGFDGVVMPFSDGHVELMAFDPTQVKSAIGNNGNFDPNDANILRQSAKVDEQIKQWAEGKLDGDVIIDIGRPSEILKSFGLSDLPIHLTQKILKKAVNKHEVSPEDLNGLVQAVQTPLAVFASKKGAGHLVVLTELKHEKGNIIVALDIDVKRREIVIHDIRSLHPKDTESLMHWVADGMLLGYEKNKGFDWLVGNSESYSRREQVNEALAKASVYEGAWEGKSGVLNQGDMNLFFQEARGQIKFGQDITETPSVISLLKGADLSTFIHESGHFFLQVQADLAARIQAQINDGATVTDGERSIVDDMSKLLDWMGIKADQDGSALDRWLRMGLEEQREHHEKFARGFEAYAFEGRAPTMELQSLFQRFRSWLLNIYRELKALKVDLNDEVRGVMDRMLATNDQIEAAEMARNMGPLFTPQNAQGVIEDWQAYHALANEATQAGVDELQAKSLKELQWASRARNRALKDLQKQHNTIRSELMMEARREVMSQPIYRAWHFLTGKMSAEDRAALKPDDVRKSTPGTLDPSIDSMFVAISKLGGLDRAQVESQWGIDKKERSPSPVFGKPLLRRNDGLSIDAMGELLAEYGYLTKDEHGKYDIQDFEAAFDSEYRGSPVYSIAHDYANSMGDRRPGEGLDLENIGSARLDLTSLKELGLDESVVDRLQGLNMTAKDGIHPDIVADLIVDESGIPVFSSGNELAQRLAAVTPMKVAIEKLTDQMMLERFGELATPEAIQLAADQAVHNELRAKMLHAEARALERAMDVKSPGKRGAALLPQAAKAFAQRLIAGLKVRDIRPGQYAAAEARAAKSAERAFAKNDLEVAAEQKRIQIVNNYATREAYAAQDEIRSAVAYLRKFDKRSKTLDPDYYDQITAILERFDLVPSTSLKAIDKRTSLASWLSGLEEQGIVPDIPPELAIEAFRKSYKDMTVEELRGLRDTIKQLDHLGRVKNKLLTAKSEREFAEIRDEMVDSIIANGKGRVQENRTPSTVLGERLVALKKFWASHIKAATWARIMDGGQDGGPVWENLIRTANAAGDMEVGMREQATKELSALVAPVIKEGKMGGKGESFPSIGRSLNKEQRLAIALNIGNESNTQRLLGGEGWTVEQIKPVLDTLSTADWNFVQSVWDYFESYRPEIGAKQRRVYGSEPQWIDARPITVQTRDGDTINLRGGYYPVKYDPRASERAESHMEAEDAKRMMQGAYTSATTRRSFTKQRAESVVGRPLMYSLDGLYSGINEVIHDLAWHEWLIDANRIIKNPKIAEAMRDTYGAEVHQQFKDWIKDIAEGDRGAQNANEKAAAWIRQSVSISGLGFNAMSAMLQPFGITQSMVRIGAKWVGRGVAKAISDPVGTSAEINEMSEFMRTRSLTRMRELAELRNQVKGQTKLRAGIDAGAYALMLRAQQLVDIPTWWGAYEKAIAEGNDSERASALADQAVIDAQGGGTTKDLSAIERGRGAYKLFTVFYSFMNTSLNMGAAQTMTAESKAKLAADYLMIYVVPVVLIALMKSAFTPGDSGDWEDPEKIAAKLLKEEVSYLMGMFVYVRELSGIVDAFNGKPTGEYSGPAGTRLISDTLKLAKQVGQGELDDGLRKSVVNVAGELFRLPTAQVNRSITGAKALAEGDTKNPAALVFGYEEAR